MSPIRSTLLSKSRWETVNDVVFEQGRAAGAYRWMALVLAGVLMATGFVAFTRDVSDAQLQHQVHISPSG